MEKVYSAKKKKKIVTIACDFYFPFNCSMCFIVLLRL